MVARRRRGGVGVHVVAVTRLHGPLALALAQASGKSGVVSSDSGGLSLGLGLSLSLSGRLSKKRGLRLDDRVILDHSRGDGALDGLCL